MSSARARANHGLYLARVLLSAWREAADRAEVPASILEQAFEPAISDHLVAAYGWFLLHVARPDALPERPPRHSGELPAPGEGRAVAGEILEFQRLEREGWLARLLGSRQVQAVVGAAPGSLAADTGSNPSLEDLASWAETLSALFERMEESLDEY